MNEYSQRATIYKHRCERKISCRMKGVEDGTDTCRHCGGQVAEEKKREQPVKRGKGQKNPVVEDATPTEENNG